MDESRYLKVGLDYEEGEWFLHIFDETDHETLLYYPLTELVEQTVGDSMANLDRQEAFESLNLLADELLDLGNTVKQKVMEEILDAERYRNLGGTN